MMRDWESYSDRSVEDEAIGDPVGVPRWDRRDLEALIHDPLDADHSNLIKGLIFALCAEAVLIAVFGLVWLCT